MNQSPPAPGSKYAALINDLKTAIRGEVYADANTLAMYATDASLYQVEPVAVVVPTDEKDVVEAHRLAKTHRVNILPRGAGTSLAGQAVNKALVLDFNKYMNRILEFNPEKKWIRVQPGLIHSELNDFLKPYGLLYGPDPATSNRANIGGVVANNSSGSRSIVYGKAIDHLHSMRVLLAGGEILEFAELDKQQLKEKMTLTTREGAIYRTLHEIVETDGALIHEKFPKVMRRVSGYPLDAFLDSSRWNLSQLLCGSEGTLATILEVTLKLVDRPKAKGVCTVHYRDRIEAITEVKNLLKFGPSAVELLDDTVIDIARSNDSTRQMAGFIEGAPGAILIVEFYGDTQEEVQKKFEALAAYLSGGNLSYAWPFYPEGEIYTNIWEVRKKGLGLLLSMRTAAKPIPFIEDACIPVDKLGQYVREIVALCDAHNTQVILYAHASVGVLHVRPVLDLRNGDDLQKFLLIGRKTLELVMKYEGAWSGEHGDGIVRGFGVPLFFGERIYADFKKVKQAFDPENRMNPGRIIDTPAPDQLLRYGPDYHDQEIRTVYHYRKELGFGPLVHMCNGVGVCQRIKGGVMCPSYKASLDEKDSTRGRANVLRLTLSGQLHQGDLTSDELFEVLDLCVSCKSCKTECPSNVDMAKLKSEVLQLRYDKKGIGLRGRFIQLSDAFARWFSGPQALLINAVTRTRIFRRALEWGAGIDARRILDPYASRSLSQWYRRSFNPLASGPEVVLFADTYIHFHETYIGKKIIQILDGLDYRVQLVDAGGSQRPLISNGFLRKAKKRGTRMAEKLRPYIERGLPVIVCEPGAYSALVEDIPDLLDDAAMGELLVSQVISLEHFLANILSDNEKIVPVKAQPGPHVIHGHCHQKALEGTRYLDQIFSRLGEPYQLLDTTCCGMAGAFGFEKEHYDFSKKIFDHDLGKKLAEMPADQMILASGFSCRHQISDFARQKVRHWIEVLDIV